MQGWRFESKRDHTGEMGLWITKGSTSIWVEPIEIDQVEQEDLTQDLFSDQELEE